MDNDVKKVVYEIEWYNDFEEKIRKSEYRNIEYMIEKYRNLKATIKSGYCKVVVYTEESGVKTLEDDYLFGFDTAK